MEYRDYLSKKAIYLRVSTDKQDTGLESQRLKAINYCKERGFDLEGIEFYADKVSGAKAERKELGRLLQDCRDGRIDTVIVISLSRLSRSLSHLLDVTNELSSMSVTLISISEQIDFSTPIGKMILAVVGSIAQLEREQISARVRRGLELAKANGKSLGRARKIDHDLVINLFKQGLSYRQIAEASKSSSSNCYRIVQKYLEQNQP